jgi:4-hydroxy-2-oxoheptanedioate aldolase
MAAHPRLNGIVRALEQGHAAFVTFTPMADIESAVQLTQSAFDGMIIEGEHVGWDVRGLRDVLQYSLNRQQIVASGSLAPAVTPIVRIPANGVEKNLFLAKQALDLGCYGVMFPHISTADEAYNAVSACRYPRLKDRPNYEPAGIRGDGPFAAARYWGLSLADYYARADVWPLDPKGEILAIIQIEDTTGIANLRDMLKNVPGIGAIMIGEGDLAQELGVPRQYEHPRVLAAIAEIVAICHEFNVVVGHAHAERHNIARLVDEGFRLFIANAPRSYDTLDYVRAQAGRS